MQRAGLALLDCWALMDSRPLPQRSACLALLVLSGPRRVSPSPGALSRSNRLLTASPARPLAALAAPAGAHPHCRV